jgi:hypothetical protein
VIDQCNSHLSSITDFYLKADVSDTAIDFYIVEGANQLDARLASGFQKFIISIALRLALTSVTPASSDFIIIDEGFGCMDGENISRLSNMFALIAGEYQFTFIISHVEELQNIIDQPLHIQSRMDADMGQSCSYVCNDANVRDVSTAISSTKGMSPVKKTRGKRTADVGATLVDSGPGVVNTTKTKKVSGAASVHCECGSTVNKGSYAGHCKTAKHLKWLQSN